MKPFKSFIKQVLSRNGWFLRKTRGLPAGVDLFLDLSRLAPEPFQNIFDVGAHHGETAELYTQNFPGAVIYSFEPVATNFTHLASKARQLPNVKCFSTALGAKTERLKIELGEDSQTHSLRGNLGSTSLDARRSEDVNVSTVDAIMQSEGITKLSLLKIDTEGFEIPVLQGAATALAEGRIDFILLESSLDPADSTHSSLIKLQQYLAPSGYSLVTLYDQMVWPNPSRLAYFNALFAHRSVAVR